MAEKRSTLSTRVFRFLGHVGAGQMRKNHARREFRQSAQPLQQQGEILGSESQAAHACFALDRHAQSVLGGTTGRRFFQVFKIGDQRRKIAGCGGSPVFGRERAHQRHYFLAKPGLTQDRAFAHRAHGEASRPSGVQSAGHRQEAVTVCIRFDYRHN